MLKLESTTVNGGGARTCDTCRSAASAVYCRADLAYLCTSCDARIHASNQLASRHERVWVCESCERAPAAFLCKADSASLCATCDAEIHSANPLARRHHRIPVPPIPGTLYGPSAAAHGEAIIGDGDDDDEATSWLLLNPMKNGDGEQGNEENGALFGGEVDEYLDLGEYNNQFDDGYDNQQQNYSVPQRSYGGGDSVVPIQLGLEGGYSYPTSMSQTVSLSSIDVGVVPESTTSEITVSHTRPPKGTIDLFSSPPIQVPNQLTPMDREARVLRYREKKKNRKFEKTIRYASRKAYAETRPRIKGRFAKRTDVEVEVDQMFSASLMAESSYGVVPSF
ncbi:GATA-4/5/6 transcription factor [Handroanthus impetiginosus]|uniref:GATA-4/5/6 transcription factor n=1 Tax=Handroanthus impetiginosus TaxID=429701 RepID=A0A2G9GS63_9LAMI|nr:GATA-4/5/6 transcription factor [Handroanthus impetiginosus]